MSALKGAFSQRLLEELELLIDARIHEALRHRQPDAKRWMTVREAAEYLGTTEVGVRGRINRGRIPVRRQGRSLLIDRVQLDQLLEEER